MEVRPDVIIALGYGKYARSDTIVGLEPIEEHENRGPGRRTRVFVQGRAEPIIASRTEETILRDMIETPDRGLEALNALDLIEDLLQDLIEIGPMLRRSIREEAGLDLAAIERRIRNVLAPPPIAVE